MLSFLSSYEFNVNIFLWNWQVYSYKINTRHNEVVFSLNVYHNAHSLNKKRNIFKKRNSKSSNIILSLKGKNLRSSYFCMFPVIKTGHLIFVTFYTLQFSQIPTVIVHNVFRANKYSEYSSICRFIPFDRARKLWQ